MSSEQFHGKARYILLPKFSFHFRSHHRQASVIYLTYDVFVMKTDLPHVALPMFSYLTGWFKSLFQPNQRQ